MGGKKSDAGVGSGVALMKGAGRRERRGWVGGWVGGVLEVTEAGRGAAPA